MTGPAYPAARVIASTIHEHFSRHIGEAVRAGHAPVAVVPSPEEVEAIVDAAFWASFRREEGYLPKISLAFVRPEQTAHPLRFAYPFPLDPAKLARIAPAVERPGIHLAVCRQPDELSVWGVTMSIPMFCFVLEVVSPGVLVVKHHRSEGMGKFVNVAVLEGDRIKIVDEQGSSLPDCPPLLASMLGFEAPASWSDSINPLVQLAVSMRAHQRGGSLLVVPESNDQWHESIVQPIQYSISPAFAELTELMNAPVDVRHHRDWQRTLERAIEAAAGLTAVDGATLITDHYKLLAFGAKITRRSGFPQVEQITVTEPVHGSSAAIVHISQLGGTRHLSAAQFVQDQRNGLALVASQDGRFTVFGWSPCEHMVHAHRVEALLM